ncbi:MAG TPA: hypothetical protein PLX89_20995 [Verrucomicrobiota bacterium]|nr:hypothetical protein [Verrucomicrobiales bacterium]HRI15482.1 hypothetical protein [Verrucomicrobiota bacterium]
MTSPWQRFESGRKQISSGPELWWALRRQPIYRQDRKQRREGAPLPPPSGVLGITFASELASPSPQNGATNVPIAQWLRWDGGVNTLANRGFENGLTGWIVKPPALGAGRIAAGTTFQPAQPGVKAVRPVEGAQMAILNFNEPGSGSLQLEFTVPAVGRPVRLVFSEWLSLGSFAFSPSSQFDAPIVVLSLPARLDPRLDSDPRLHVLMG